MLGTLPTYKLKKWSDDDCLCVFTQRSSRRTDFNMQMHLKEIGEKIVKSATACLWHRKYWVASYMEKSTVLIGKMF